MGLFTIVIALILFLFLAFVTLMMNPPERWVQRLTEPKKKPPATGADKPGPAGSE